MSSKVFFGEKRTPKMRANGLRDACASGARAGIVAIEGSSTTELRVTAFWKALRRSAGKYFSGGILAQRRWCEQWQLASGQGGNGGEQFASVVVLRLMKDCFGGAKFNEFAGAHDGDAHGHLGDDRQAVRD